MEIKEEEFIFSDDAQLIDVKVVHQYLHEEAYWAKGIPLQTVQTAIENSLCFGVYKASVQVGFARWVTDRATFAYLCDVFILEAYRGVGLSKKLMSLMMFHPDLQGLRRYQLATLDAHKLYEQFGFKALAAPDRQMEISINNIYDGN